MLFIHTSNQLENLKNQFVGVTRKPLDAIFAKEIVVVQNAGMSRWLSMEVANISGISANFEYLFPAEFMWRLLRLVSPDIPEESQCSVDTLRFHITQELTQNFEDYPELSHYILHNNAVNQRDVWALANELAQLLDQYLFYRGDWVTDWEHNDKALRRNWQARLWRRCVTDKKLIHWLTLQNQFKSSLASNNKQIDFPQRLSFFSMAALSPGYIDLLGELAQHVEIHAYIINPCENLYWGDIQSKKLQAKLAKDNTLQEQPCYRMEGNPLLASMGKQGRDFIHTLLEIENATTVPQISHFNQQFENPSLLHKIQQDIYQLKKPEQFFEDSLIDNSIIINSCHSTLREVEVLHNQILAELDGDAQLSPSDIVVMMPDIENYAPFIEALFSNSKDKLPFSIADREAQSVFQLIEALNKIFTLPNIHYDVESVFEILEYEDIRDHFNLDQNQLEYCRVLAKSTNIRWGISDKERVKKQLPNTVEHTWKYAIDALLLGYSMAENVEYQQLYTADRNLALLPYADIEGSSAITLANFKRFTDTLFSINAWQHQSHCLDKWIIKTRQFIKKISVENHDQQTIFNAIDALENSAKLAEFELTMPFSVYLEMLKETLQNISSSEKYLGYGITFCSLVPMRSVPFKIVALLGMNDGQFPRQDNKPSIDLMANSRIAGDRSRRDEDRYLFLESILAARQKLLISFIGQSIKDNTEIPPANLVSELLDVMFQYSQKPISGWVTKHPLHAFSSRYFVQDHNKNPASNDLYSYASEYTNIDQSKTRSAKPFIGKKLAKPDESFKHITLDDLIRFYKNPAKEFLKHRFGIHTYNEDKNLKTREPFVLESFKDTEIRQLIRDSLLKTDDETSLEVMSEAYESQLLARAKGLLPYGQVGDEIFTKQHAIMQSFHDQLPDLDNIKSATINLELQDFSVSAKLDNISSNGLITIQLNPAYAGDYIALWLKHLYLNASLEHNNTSGVSYFYSPDHAFILHPVDDAKTMLTTLLNYYWKGLSLPLLFFPKSSFALYKDGKESISKSSDKWNDSKWFAGEKSSFENVLLHPDVIISKTSQPQEFLEISREFFAHLFNHLEEIQ